MVNMENYEEYMLLYADGELTPDEEQALLAFVGQHPNLQKELDAYASTRLQPDTQMVYADKDSLLKEEEPKRIALLASWKVYAAAASVVLFAVVFMLNKNSNNIQDTPQIAITDTIEKPEPIEEKVQEELIAKEDTILYQKNHAVPVEPVAVKQQPAPKPHIVETVLPQQPKPVVPEPIVEQEEVLAIETPKDTVATEAVAQEVEQPKIEEEQPEPVVAQQAEPVKKKNGFMANVLTEKADDLGDLGKAVNEKLMAVRHVRDDIKNTRVHFQIGKKELFTVRL